ncbi:hypothetical protein E7681_16935 [Thalassobius vesicularis]|uniref:Uncharacterized protein n=1 Tax=Thalassobius vesicularis TaxID=1294297 RepID=A0A4S3M5B6_9RHOB|nr:hypothetical protein [Thalassobius vesicularis]THD71798.1 hypothetical protein E7681_16935 [Thalassobius vesicularis]
MITILTGITMDNGTNRQTGVFTIEPLMPRMAGGTTTVRRSVQDAGAQGGRGLSAAGPNEICMRKRRFNGGREKYIFTDGLAGFAEIPI